MELTAVSTGRILRGLAYALPVAAPLLLLLDPQVMFAGDWKNHLWMIGYYGEYFRQHGEMPTALNIVGAVGVAQPVFYGYLLYPLLGLFSAWWGASVALRVGVALLLVIQFGALIAAGNRIFGSRLISYFTGVSMVCATYPLTNLFHRGAIPEFFGTGFFVTAVAWAARAAVAEGRSQRIYFRWLAAVFLVLALGSHPPTAVLGAATVAVLGLGAAWGGWGERVPMARATRGALVAAAVWGALVLAPWVYATARIGPQLAVATPGAGFYFLPDRSDSFWGRFSPFPFDRWGAEMGIYDVGAPFLEAQLSVALLVFVIWNLRLLRASRRPGMGVAEPAGQGVIRGVLAAAGVWFIGLAWVSISPPVADWFRVLAPAIQYVYRLVSFCNAALLVAVFASGALVVRSGGYGRKWRGTELVLTACLTVTVLGAWIKLQHAVIVGLIGDAPQFEPGGSRAGLITQGRNEPVGDYNVPGRLRELTPVEQAGLTPIRLPVGTAGADFGVAGPGRIGPQKSAWVVTNAVVFPWHEVVVDGRLPGAEDVARVGHFMAVRVASDARELRAVWRPEPRWWFLHRLSQAAMAAGLAFTAGWALWRGLGRTRNPSAGG